MKLTDVEQDLVTENHNLIYWYANYRHLDVAEWYGLLAIELCTAIQTHDATKSKIATYFKIRCDNLVFNEHKKSKCQKNTHNGHIEIKDEYHGGVESNVAFAMDLEELYTGEHGEILRMKADGYTQSEIATAMGIGQSYVSQIIERKRKEYYENN